MVSHLHAINPVKMEVKTKVNTVTKQALDKLDKVNNHRFDIQIWFFGETLISQNV
jgi:BMFP domain-containing protein YqiC